MVKRGYQKEFAGALVAASGCVGPIIPPSSTALIYAVAAEASVSKLFVGGYFPGFVIAGIFMLYTYIVAKKRGYPAEPMPTLKSFAVTFRRAIIPLLLPVIIMGGILSGMFTATESAAVAVLYCFVIGCFVYRTIKLRDIPRLLKNSATSSCIVLAVMMTANYLGYILTLSRIPQTAAAAISAWTQSPIVFLLMINVVLLIAGCFLDAASAIVIFTPILLPACRAFGVDIIFFGVMMTVNLMVGVLTPPVGLNLYVVSSVAKIDILRLAKDSIPFMVMLCAVLLLMVFFPQSVLFLPGLMK
jgi:C4-dicarboxylate transporter DctM subunit